MIIALTDEQESTIKRLFFDKDTGEPILHPENPDRERYPDIRVRSLSVQGIVKYVVKAVR